MRYKEIGLLLIALLLLSGCSKTLHQFETGGIPCTVVTPSFWAEETNAYKSRNILADLSPLKRLCAFSIVWIWIAMLISDLREESYRLTDWMTLPLTLAFFPIVGGIVIMIVVLFFITAIGLLSYAFSEVAYILDPFFVSFCLITIIIFFASWVIFAPLLEMIRHPSFGVRSLGLTFTAFEVLGILLTLFDITKLFSE